MIGTGDFMAPEVINGSYTKQCDIFSFAIVTYELVFDTLRPYGDAMLVEQLVANNPQYRPIIPQGAVLSTEEVMLVELMQDCWCHDPNARPTFAQIRVRLDDM